MRRSFYPLLTTSLAIRETLAQTATLSPVAQAAQASSISQILSPSYAGFGIEPSNLFSFTGGNDPNDLSINLLQNLAGYSGAPPHLRIGGNTADYFIYDSSYSNHDIRRNPNPTGQGDVPSDIFTFGPNYFNALDRFPRGTPITFGLNLAYEESDYITNIVAEAQAAVDHLKNVQLYSFEIGNEPDLYVQNGFRKAPWGGQVYTQQWLTRAGVVYEQVLKPAGLPQNFFEAPATASTIGNTFEINFLVQDGITKALNGSDTYLFGWNQHDYFYFVDVSSYGITLDYLTQLSNTESQFAYWATQVGIALGTGFPYFLREMASAGPVGIQGISDTFGASLWTLNFFCYAATLGISSVQMHMTDNSWAAAWQPIRIHNQDPNVRPSYYAFAAMAQLIGSGNGTTQIAPLAVSNIPGGYPDFVRTYAAYTNGNLGAIVIINGKPSNATVINKPSLTLSVKFPTSLAGQTLYISSLIAPGVDSTSSTTWNGLSFESSNDGTATSSTSAAGSATTTLQIASDGTAQLTIRDSSAIIANLGFQLGEVAVTINGTPGPSSSGSTSSGQGSSSDQGSSGKKSSATLTVARESSAMAVAFGIITTVIAMMSSISSINLAAST